MNSSLPSPFRSTAAAASQAFLQSGNDTAPAAPPAHWTFSENVPPLSRHTAPVSSCPSPSKSPLTNEVAHLGSGQAGDGLTVGSGLRKVVSVGDDAAPTPTGCQDGAKSSAAFRVRLVCPVPSAFMT